MIKFYGLIVVFCLAAAGVLLPGCQSWDEITNGPVHIAVNDSPLNWMEILYLPKPGAPTTRITMRDKGEVRVERGRSKLVNTSFAYEYEEDSWGEREVVSFWVPHKRQIEVYQTLVNYGILKVPKEPDEPPVETILVKGNLNGRKIDRYVFDDALIFEIEKLVRLYSRTLTPIKETQEP